MKQATITLKLDKHLEVVKHEVTPIEALLLVAEHHKNVGGNPVEVHKDSIKDITRTEDEELARLRTRYVNAKVKAVLIEVKTLPTDFDDALKKGIALVLPSSTTFAESGKK